MMATMTDAGTRLRAALALEALVVARAVAWLVARIRGGRREPDAFYDPPPGHAGAPGTLLRHEPFARGLPGGARAWRILYTTTRADGAPAVASGLVVVPDPRPEGALPVIAWAHGTTGVARRSAPSLLDDPFGSGAMPDPDAVVARGWAIVATDYIGLGTAASHAYLVGPEAAHAVLDAVRAARALEAAGPLGPTVAWGHSQGGGVALWTGLEAPAYAPDVPLDGVAALSPASDLPGLAGNLGVLRGGAIFASYTIAGYAATYPDVVLDDWVRAGCRRLVRAIAAHGIAGTDVIVSIVAGLLAPSPLWSRDPATGALGARLRENVPLGRIEVPVLLGQGLADPLVLPGAQAAFVDALRAAGTDVDARTYEGFDHTGVVRPPSPLVGELLDWTAARFAAG